MTKVGLREILKMLQDMKHPSVSQILEKYGYFYESKVVKLLEEFDLSELSVPDEKKEGK